MAISYPVAATVMEALSTRHLALTAARAAQIAGTEVEFVSEWVSSDMIGSDLDYALHNGFAQIYEDHAGMVVYAISYWRGKSGVLPLMPKQPPKRQSRQQEEQLELFPGPDQSGYEHRDPNNPAIILVDEEGDGARFGALPRRSKL